MKLHELKPAQGSTRKKVRKGRGAASGLGKTAGRGQDGQKSRSGGGVRPGFEGGQMPITRRLPKRGFTNAKFRKEFGVINIEMLNRFEKDSIITNEALKESGLIKNKYKYVKILGNGEVTIPLTVKVDKVSKSAQEKILKAGGKVEVV